MKDYAKILMASGAFCMAAAIPNVAAAQNDSSQDSPVAPNRSANSGQIGEIVVTARRVNESAQRVPVAITVLGEETLRDSTIKNIRDLQGSAPALFFSSGAGGPSAANVAIRGQTQADVQLTTDPSVAVYLNEVSLPRQIGLRASFLDLDQIEVLKGPQGTLFGKNTTGGALLLRSKRPSLTDFGGFVNLQAGNYDLMQVSGAIGGPLIPDKLGVRIAAQQTFRGGFGRNGAGQQIGDQEDLSYRASLLWEPADSVRLFLTADGSNGKNNGSIIRLVELNPLVFNAAGVPQNALANTLRETALELGLKNSVGALTVADYTTAYNEFARRGFQTRSFYDTNNTQRTRSTLDLYGFSGDLSVDFGSVTFRSITGYRHTDRIDDQDYGATGFSIVQPINFTNAGSFTQEVQLLDNSGGRFGWIMGGYYGRERGVEGSTTTQLRLLLGNRNPNMTDSTVTNKTYAVFAQANYEIIDDLRLTAGARYTETKQELLSRNRNPTGCNVPIEVRANPAICEGRFVTGSNKPSWLASLDYQATPNILLYASVANSFRGGGLNARGGATVESYAAFGPEEATNYEVGFKGDLLDRHLRINAAAYYTDYTGIQRSTTLISPTGALITVVNNANSGEVYGAEVEVTARPVDNLTLGGAFNWTHTAYKDYFDAILGDRTDELFAVPEYQFSATVKYVVPLGPDELSFFGAYRWQDDVTFRSEATFDDTVTQKAFGQLEGRIAYHMGNPDIELAVFGKNLTNEKYFTNFLAFDRNLGYNIGFVGEPRTYGLELRIAFGGG